MLVDSIGAEGAEGDDEFVGGVMDSEFANDLSRSFLAARSFSSWTSFPKSNASTFSSRATLRLT